MGIKINGHSIFTLQTRQLPQSFNKSLDFMIFPITKTRVRSDYKLQSASITLSYSPYSLAQMLCRLQEEVQSVCVSI